MSRRSYHRQIIDLLMQELDGNALVLEIAKHNPAAVLAAHKRIQERDADPVEKVLRSGEMGAFVSAIRKRRELTGEGLKEAKDYVEALRDRLGIVTQ